MKPHLRLQFEVQSDFSYLPFLTRIFKNIARTQVLVEAFNNAVIHGNRHQQKKWIGIEIRRHGGKTLLRVVDQGRGMKKIQKPKIKNQNLWKMRGRGITLIQAFSAKHFYRKTKTEHIFEATFHDK